tara:strand:- start:227 stop:388 length:162 start_codon:yes stop_codon:yes gene_type:complete
MKKISQNYLKDIIKQYPKIKSGRKNYLSHYRRILKNINLVKDYIKNIEGRISK